VVPVAVNVVTLEPELDTFTVWEAARVLPAENVKLREFGFAVRGLGPGEFAFKVTGMLSELAPEAILMNPTDVPEAGAPAPTDTLSESGVMPLEGVTWSQLLFDSVETVTVAAPLEEVSRTVWAVGVTPVWVLNVSCAGLAVSVVVCARAVSKQPSNAHRKLPNKNGDFPRLFTTCS
jgi:hypothetical protein